MNIYRWDLEERRVISDFNYLFFEAKGDPSIVGDEVTVFFESGPTMLNMTFSLKELECVLSSLKSAHEKLKSKLETRSYDSDLEEYRRLYDRFKGAAPGALPPNYDGYVNMCEENDDE